MAHTQSRQRKLPLGPIRGVSRWIYRLPVTTMWGSVAGLKSAGQVPGRAYGSLSKGVTGHIRRSLIAGLILLIPAALTYLVVRFVFDVVDGVLKPWIEWILEQFGVDWTLPGPGVAAAVILIYLAGVFVAFRIGRMIVGKSQAAVLEIPFVRSIYSAARQLVESFSGSTETGFKRVVIHSISKGRRLEYRFSNQHCNCTRQ